MNSINKKIIYIFAILSVLALIRIVDSEYVPNPVTGTTQLPTESYCLTHPPGIVELVSPWYCSDIDKQIRMLWFGDPNKPGSGYVGLGLIAVSFSFAIASLIFMLGVAMKNERLRTYGIGEIYEALATTIVVVLFAFVALALFGIIPGLTGTINPYQASLTYMAQTINSTNTVAFKLFQIAVIDAYYSSYSLTICGDGLSLQLVLCTAPITKLFGRVLFFTFFWPAWSTFIFLVDGLISLYTQYYLVLFFLYASIPVFFIPGIILRAFIPTRSLGGMMISIAIGFYFVMPILFGVSYYFTSQNIQQQLSHVSAELTKFGSGGGAVSNAVTPVSPLVLVLGEIRNTFSSFWLNILFFPALNIAITYAFIIQISELIGGMARTSTRLRALV